MLDDSVTASHLESTSLPDSATATISDSAEKTRSLDREEQHSLGVGARFAGFQIRGLLGRGAMGVVYEAWDPTLERRVALKLLRSPSRHAAERLLREARALARLDHPNVVRIWAADEHRGALYIAMELIEGQNLREWLQTPRSWTEVLPVMIGAGRGLAAAHAARVIHRDFKPENVRVGLDGQARVLDFGVARVSAQHPDHLSTTIDGSQTYDEEDELPADSPLSGSFVALPIDESPLTEIGALIGTLLYMAPEQHDREPADERSDQFAFCTTLFEAIYGAHPFPAKSRAELALLVAEHKVRFPADAASKAPRWLERVILKGLSPAREDRFATIEELIDALERHPRRRRARNRALAIAAGMLGAIAVTWTALPRSEDACVDVGSEIDEALGQRQRREIAARFAALDTPWAEEMGKRVSAELDNWAARWIEARTEACKLRHSHREATVIDERRAACLAERLAEAGALGAVLSEAQQRVLANAERALTALEDPRVCLSDQPPVGHASISSAHDELVDEMLELEWLALTGGDTRTLARARALVEKIRALPRSDANLFLLGDALVTLAEAELFEGNTQRAEALLHEAIQVAERTTADGLRAHAVVDLGWLLATSPGRSKEAVPLLEDAAALLERVGNPRVSSVRRQQALAEALLASGDSAGARQMFETMLAEAGPQPNAFVQYTTSLGLGRVAKAEKNYGAALEHSRDALAQLELYGTDSPMLVTPLINIGVALTELGRYDEAREAFERGLALRRTLFETDASPGNRRLLGEDLMNLAILEGRAGASEAAVAAYREALALLPEDDHAARSLVLFNLGVDHQIAGRLEQALGNYEESLRLAERVLPLEHEQVVGARLGVGSVLVMLGREAEARAPLERCLAEWPASLKGKPDEAELHFALARMRFALAGHSPDIESFAIKAADLYRRLGDVTTAETVEAWLATHASKR